ncbi:helix-turn-helix domain-containing protein [Labrys miyagiensis]|uniref:helix-turn-helix domain-containing protein n=1 Tax=Labrys miyagiensis TaxID=346912 RepID=UPI0024E12839|nr:AraC family transcriptional regulator [Labrys miyagiensis]
MSASVHIGKLAGGQYLRVGPARSVIAATSQLGHQPDKIFESAGVDPNVFSDPDNLIDVVELGRIAAAAAKITGREDIGLLTAALVEPGDLGLVGLLVLEGPDVKTSLLNLVRFLHFHDRPAVISLSVYKENVHLRYQIRNPNFPGANIIHDCSVGIAYRLMKVLCGPQWAPNRILLSRRVPTNPTPYYRYFGSMLEFNAPEDAVVFATSDLARQVRPPGSHNEPFDARDLREQLIQKMSAMLGFGAITGTRLAAEFNVSRRTLDRKLSLIGTSCVELLDQVRLSRAQRLLAAGDAPLSDIAFALGYSEQSAFTRFFKRTTGLSPRKWREVVANDS